MNARAWPDCRASAGASRRSTRRCLLGLKRTLLLALLPTAIALANLALLEHFSHQRLLFASLAPSAFSIYLDPRHDSNAVRALVAASVWAATTGLAAYLLLSHGYGAAVWKG